MRLLPTEPSPEFAVWDFQPGSTLPAQSRRPAANPEPEVALNLPAVLRGMAERLAYEPGRVLRSLTDVARELCGADAAGICLERDGRLVPAETLPVLLASGTCESLTGVEVPRAECACAVAIADQRAKLFQIPASWLPVNAPGRSLAHGITAPWRAGNVCGTLWILKHSDSEPFSVSRYRTLLTLANLAGSAFLHLAEREVWQREVYLSTSEVLADTLMEQVQAPLQTLRRELEIGLRRSREAAGNPHLRSVSDGLRSMTERIDAILCLPSRPA